MNLTRYLDRNNDIILPKKIKMRWQHSKKNNIFDPTLKDMKSTYSGNIKMVYAYIYNFIDSRVGLKYDDIYSEFCKKIPYWVCDINTRKEFNELLFGNEYRRPSRYYIDDEGYLIRRSLHAPIKSKPIIIPNNESTTVYKVNKEYFRWFGKEGHKKFCRIFGIGAYHKILENEYISVDQYNKIYTKITDEITAPFSKEDFLKHAFEKIIKDGKVVYPEDKDYTRYLYEDRRRKAKEKRELMKERNKLFDEDI